MQTGLRGSRISPALRFTVISGLDTLSPLACGGEACARKISSFSLAVAATLSGRPCATPILIARVHDDFGSLCCRVSLTWSSFGNTALLFLSSGSSHLSRSGNRRNKAGRALCSRLACENSRIYCFTSPVHHSFERALSAISCARVCLTPL